MELCQIACEKFAAAEKTPYERDNQAAATMIKVRLILSESFTTPTLFAPILFLFDQQACFELTINIIIYNFFIF
jgi:hypothetical protein